ncbi:DUF1120 domain-containing protein [Pectobacterium fontis]|uniref:Fimbrial protein n=1 Tax=Pectobacterium fontis TaxID=2558042 RepID=A0A7V8L4U8_9GAMM|nr:fimbrial protein [Pectobacterium fontis]KHN51566.1 fimbrial protein [Pectobacterium fontis]
MNRLFGRCGFALLLGVTFASAADVIAPFDTVMPELIPDTRCNLSVSNPVVDYGIMSRWQLQDLARGSVSPGMRSLMFNAVCPYTRTIKLLVQGEGGERGDLRYGEHGVTRLRLMDVQLDGHAVELRTLTSTGELKNGGSHAMMLTPGTQLIPVLDGRPVRGKALTARLEIQPILAESEAQVSSPLRSESMLTFSLIN